MGFVWWWLGEFCFLGWLFCFGGVVCGLFVDGFLCVCGGLLWLLCCGLIVWCVLQLKLCLFV